MSVALIGLALAILEGDSKFKEINAYTVQGDAARSQYSPEDDSDLSSTVNEVCDVCQRCIDSGIGMKPSFVMSVALIGVALAILEGDSEAKEINAYTVQDDAAGSQYSPEDDSDPSSAANVVGQFLMKSVGGGSPWQSRRPRRRKMSDVM
ncbi:hypothetical protein FOZ60_002323 [Perkinsus olseni]|uniref:Uncharacterized protein n=1 Tax=Perkinsus olseni TaxID=32597 RepID=A0A7J6PIR6_PEROL|nr:hypothetical protein FOZ60_002323 [Perkinsus olseni]